MSDRLVIKSHQGAYTVDFDDEAFGRLNESAAPGVHFIIDERVAELYSGDLHNVLSAPSIIKVHAIEESKSLERMPEYVIALLSRGIRRDHTLVAIGGGIVQDVTCFLSATLLRGLKWSFYPTTLLAQADSCIGSKSSINVGEIKNVLGTFTPPSKVVVVNRFLNTLSDVDIRSGLGEMLKVHAIKGAESFERIAGDYSRMTADHGVMGHYIRRSLEIKKEIIEKDEFDRGPRNVMNYGHSFGHAIESATHYSVPHGIAVTIGMDMANYVSVRLGKMDRKSYENRRHVLKRNYAGYESVILSMDAFITALTKDKKNKGDGLRLVLPDADGKISCGDYVNDDVLRSICSEYLFGEMRG